MKEQEPKKEKVYLFEEILKVLEENNSLCMDDEAERRLLAGKLTEVFLVLNSSTDGEPDA